MISSRAFISRCLGLTTDNGRLGMLTIHSFMFISSYESLRNEITDNSLIETGCHLGTKTEFDLSNPNAQGFIAFIVNYTSNKSLQKSANGVWFKVTNENDTEKREVFEKLLVSNAQ